MLAKRIIPCLDVTNGRVVKGVNFVDLIDAGDPLELAKKYDREGADELVFLDITASSDKRDILIELVEKTASQLFIPFTVGGGITSVETIRDLLSAGADKVSMNSSAVKNPNFIYESSSRFGAQCIVLAIDAKRIVTPQESDNRHLPIDIRLDAESKWEVYTHGGRKPTGIDAVKWAQFGVRNGAGEILLTSMDADGTKAGYDLSLTAAINNLVSVPVIASGGAGNAQHVADVLNVCDAALLASLLHFNELSIEQIKDTCRTNHLPVR